MPCASFFPFFFNDTATTEIYTLSLHDALPIFLISLKTGFRILPYGKRYFGYCRTDIRIAAVSFYFNRVSAFFRVRSRSEEHTSELQSRQYLVCRLLLEKKKILYNSTFSA